MRAVGLSEGVFSFPGRRSFPGCSGKTLLRSLQEPGLGAGSIYREEGKSAHVDLLPNVRSSASFWMMPLNINSMW